MQQSHKFLGPCLGLAVLMMSAFAGIQSAVAQQVVDTVTKAGEMECPEMAHETAYETSPEFISWLLERPERMNVLSNAQRHEIFKEFHERRQSRTRLMARGES